MPVGSFAPDATVPTFPPDQLMRRYYFHLIRGQERIRDFEGLELPDELLPDILPQVIEEIRLERPDLLDGGRGWTLEVADAHGCVIQIVEV